MPNDLSLIIQTLSDQVDRLRIGRPAAYVYNPLVYAWPAHQQYIEKYGRGPRDVLLLGMNPGPWGMAQTGVPFGEVGMVRDWLKIDAKVSKPPRQHPKRPIQGFACSRREVSGQRLWGWAQDRFKTPKRFFKQFFVANYCPLCFMEESGRNLTPDRLPMTPRTQLLKVCDQALRQTVEYFQPKWVIGIGGFAEKRARIALSGMEVKIGQILHPSPASPIANRGWAHQIEKQFATHGIKL